MTVHIAAIIMNAIGYCVLVRECRVFDDEGQPVRPWEDHIIAAGLLGCIWVAAWVLSVIVEVLTP